MAASPEDPIIHRQRLGYKVTGSGRILPEPGSASMDAGHEEDPNLTNANVEDARPVNTNALNTATLHDDEAQYLIGQVEAASTANTETIHAWAQSLKDYYKQTGLERRVYVPKTVNPRSSPEKQERDQERIDTREQIEAYLAQPSDSFDMKDLKEFASLLGAFLKLAAPIQYDDTAGQLGGHRRPRKTRRRRGSKKLTRGRRGRRRG